MKQHVDWCSLNKEITRREQAEAKVVELTAALNRLMDFCQMEVRQSAVDRCMAEIERAKKVLEAR